jgi:hypothetical protein
MMNLMICMRGEPEQLSFLPEIAELDAGIELGSYGLAGIRSEQAWAERFALHQAVRTQFSGPLAIHGPFLGMEYAHPDHLIRDVVNRRLDMTFDAAVKLSAGRRRIPALVRVRERGAEFREKGKDRDFKETGGTIASSPQAVVVLYVPSAPFALGTHEFWARAAGHVTLQLHPARCIISLCPLSTTCSTHPVHHGHRGILV